MAKLEEQLEDVQKERDELLALLLDVWVSFKHRPWDYEKRENVFAVLHNANLIDVEGNPSDQLAAPTRQLKEAIKQAADSIAKSIEKALGPNFIVVDDASLVEGPKYEGPEGDTMDCGLPPGPAGPDEDST